MMKDMKIKRLFIETDVLHESELHMAQSIVSGCLDDKGIKHSKDIFDEVVDFAWHEADKAWEAVKRADEIYGDSALIPICGIGTYTGAPVVMNVMMEKAIKEGIEGKRMYFLQPYRQIHWDGIKRELLLKAFVKNELFTTEWDEEAFEYEFIKVDPLSVKTD